MLVEKITLFSGQGEMNTIFVPLIIKKFNYEKFIYCMCIYV